MWEKVLEMEDFKKEMVFMYFVVNKVCKLDNVFYEVEDRRGRSLDGSDFFVIVSYLRV